MSHRGRYCGWILIALPTIVWPSVERSGRHRDTRIQNGVGNLNFQDWDRFRGLFFQRLCWCRFLWISQVSKVKVTFPERLNTWMLVPLEAKWAQRLRTCVNSRRSIVQDSENLAAQNSHDSLFFSEFRWRHNFQELAVNRQFLQTTAEAFRRIPCIFWFIFDSVGHRQASHTSHKPMASRPGVFFFQKKGSFNMYLFLFPIFCRKFIGRVFFGTCHLLDIYIYIYHHVSTYIFIYLYIKWTLMNLSW